MTEKSTPQSTPKSTVNVNVKTTLLKQIRDHDPEFGDIPATHIVEFILRAWIIREELEKVKQ